MATSELAVINTNNIVINNLGIRIPEWQIYKLFVKNNKKFNVLIIFMLTEITKREIYFNHLETNTLQSLKDE